MRAALGIAVLAAGLGLVGVAAKIGQPERAVSGPSIRARPSGDVPASPPPKGSPAPAPRKYTISGVVVDDLGRPVPEAGLFGPYRQSRRRGREYAWLSECAADGRFSVSVQLDSEILERRGPLIDTVGAHGYVLRSVEGRAEDWEVLESTGRLDGLRIVLPRDVTVEGVVRDADGAPVPWAEIEWREEEVIRVTSLNADRDGAFRIEGLDPGQTFHLSAHAWGWTGEAHRVRDVQEPGETARLDIVLSKRFPGGDDWDGLWDVSGTVVDAAGRPVGDAEVAGPHFRVTPQVFGAAECGADGRFRGVLRPYPSDYRAGARLVVEAKGFARLLFDLPVEFERRLRKDHRVDDLRLVLRPEAEVCGRVLDPEGNPVDGARVLVVEQNEGFRDPYGFLECKTGSDGRFYIRELNPDADWFLLADSGILASHYVPLRGLLREGTAVKVDIPFPSNREVALTVVVKNWRPRMQITVDCIGEEMEGDTWTGTEYAGPHRITLNDRCRHSAGSAEIDIPYDVDAWRVEIEGRPCEKCTNLEPEQETVIDTPELGPFEPK